MQAGRECLDENDFLGLIEGSYPAPRRALLQDHVASCEDCARALQALSDVAGSSRSAPQTVTASYANHGGADGDEHRLTLAEPIGRFVPLGLIGRGGMGRVIAAYDPELDRKVAIKMVRTDNVRDRVADELARRLEREARAMARVAHPNIVAIHDVGRLDDEVYIAMEHVAGCTLRDWMHEGDRDWPEVVAMFRQIGAGLAAAHEAGLIHRDLKPDNVLVGEDGRARITDFGLASGLGPPLAESAGELLARTLGKDSAPSLTRTGQIVGTPAYMAPEQHGRAEVDARADQFAFCVVLYEALCGHRPFAGDTYAELSAAVREGRRAPLARAIDAPASVLRVIDRGLAIDPDARYPSMRALIADLDVRPRARRRALLAGGAVVAAAAAAGVWLAQPAAVGPSCALPADLAKPWTDAERGDVERALAAALPGAGAAAAAQLAATLDEQQARWSSTWRAVCERTHVVGDQSSELLDLRMECLDRARLQARALVARLSAGDELDARLAERALRATRAIDDPTACAALEAADVPPIPLDPERRREVKALRDDLAEQRVLYELGDVQPMLERAAAAAERAAAIDDDHLRAQALYRRALALASQQQAEEAEAAMREVAELAATLADARLTARAWGQLVKIVGVLARRPDDAVALQPIAELAVRLAANDADRASYLENMGEVHQLRGEFDTAATMYNEALELRGDDRRGRALALSRLGGLHLGRGDYAAAEAALSESLEIVRDVDGELAMSVGMLAHNLAALYRRMDDRDQARAMVEEAIAVFEAREQGRGVYLAGSLELAGNVERDAGRLDEALALHQRALAMIEAAGAPSPVTLARALENVGVDFARMGRPDDAAGQLERAAALLAGAVKPGDPALVRVQTNLSSAYAALGRVEQAIELANRGYEGALAHWGGGHHQAIWALRAVAEIRVRYGAPRPALPLCRQLVAWIAASEEPRAGTPAELASAYNLLGDAELAIGAAARARRAFEQAIAVVADAAETEAIGVRTDAEFGLARLAWASGDRTAAERVRGLFEAREQQLSSSLRDRITSWLAQVGAGRDAQAADRRSR